MKPILLLFSLFLLFNVVYCQKDSVLTNPIKNTPENKIDSIKTTIVAERFIRSMLPPEKWNFNIGTLNTLYQDNIRMDIAKKLYVEPWYKADLNDDSKTDLLAYCIDDGYHFIYAIITEGNNFSIHYIRIGYGYFHFCYPIISKRPGNPTELILYQGSLDNSNYPYISDTINLIYKFNQFIEPNINPKTYKIEKIELTTSLCDGNCKPFGLYLYPDQTVVRIDFNPDIVDKTIITGDDDIGISYKTTIDSLSYSYIEDILNYIDFPTLKDYYASSAIGPQSFTLRIKYNNGIIKEIHDSTRAGTQGLTIIYNKLFEILRKQKWEKN